MEAKGREVKQRRKTGRKVRKTRLSGTVGEKREQEVTKGAVRAGGDGECGP